ncbi:hypothetical protein [Phenylobacterium sp.]|jgi:hypothetical protein|uniref:hypothetical protein n=1 Tax=Phenylobacterium sp. TaxID=1871053 RepID=UPI002F42BF80
MVFAALSAAVVLMAGAPATAAAPSGPTASPLTVTPKVPDKVEIQKRRLVCQDEPVLGTLFPKRVCATQEEITERRRVDQAATRQAQALRPYQIDSGKLPGT